MPLTKFQKEIALLLAQNRDEESHLAGGAALHLQPNSLRYSQDLDYFHDSEVKVSTAFKLDSDLLTQNKFKYKIELIQPGYIRCIIEKKNEFTKIEWAYDSAWRFLPAEKNEEVGYILNPIDLSINKLLALVGRDEPRDFLDVLYTHKNILPLGAQCWAACGKDPGFNPSSLLELLKRRGKYRNEDFNRLKLTEEVNLQLIKEQWLSSLKEAESFFKIAPAMDVGCLYYSLKKAQFIQPNFKEPKGDVVPHFGKLGGVLPRFL